MSICKRWLTEENIQKALALYRSTSAPTLQTIADQLGTTIQTACWILVNRMPSAEHKALSKLRYSRSKMGKKNPQFGKTGEQHPRWVGLVDDGYGYQTCLVKGKRVFVHRHMMARALGLKTLPRMFDVHHINDARKDNRLDNFALTTKVGHVAIHSLQRTDSKALRLKKLSLWDAFRFTTSQ